MSTWTAERLRKWRHDQNITQREAAALLCRSQRMYRYYEAGDCPIDRAVAALLDVLEGLKKRAS